MNYKPTPQNRSLVLIEDKSIVSPDARRRIIALHKSRAIPFYIVYFAYNFLLVIGFSSAIAFFFVSDVPSIIFLLIITFGAGVGIFLYGRHAKELFGNVRKILFPCPFCQEKINFGDPWTCGNCQHENNEKENEFAVPFDRCVEKVCTKPIQNAVQCPHCQRHIVLDADRYREDLTHLSPHRGLARFTFDKKPARVFFEEEHFE